VLKTNHSAVNASITISMAAQRLEAKNCHRVVRASAEAVFLAFSGKEDPNIKKFPTNRGVMQGGFV